MNICLKRSQIMDVIFYVLYKYNNMYSKCVRIYYIIIIIFIYCNCVVTRWQWLFYM
jgi:hypothetical protein